MLKLRDGLLLNETQIVAAEFVSKGNDKTLILTLTAPATFSHTVEGCANQVILNGAEAENLWRVLSEGATKVEPARPPEFLAYVVK